MVGEQDQRNPLPDEIYGNIASHRRVHILPFTDDLASHIAAMDIVVLPSYREGFGNVLIEASAMKKPVIATDIVGCKDAVKPNETGLLVEPRNSLALKNALNKLLSDDHLREKLGQHGRKWVESEFDRKLIWQRLFGVYRQILNKDN